MSRRPDPTGSRSKRQLLLACARADGSDLRADPKLAAAVRDLDVDSSLRDGLGRQQEFDREIGSLIHALPLPEDLDERADAQWSAAARRARSWTRVLRNPAFLTALLAVLFLMGWAGWYFVERASHFPGDEGLAKTLDAALPANPTAVANLKLRPVGGVPCGKLGDALFLEHGFDGYDVPAELAARPAAAYRVFHRPADGAAIAQVLLGGGGMETPADDEGLTLFIFRASDLGVAIEPPGRWRLLTDARERWAAAVQVREDGMAAAIVSPGDADALRRRLAPLGVRP